MSRSATSSASTRVETGGTPEARRCASESAARAPHHSQRAVGEARRDALIDGIDLDASSGVVRTLGPHQHARGGANCGPRPTRRRARGPRREPPRSLAGRRASASRRRPSARTPRPEHPGCTRVRGGDAGGVVGVVGRADERIRSRTPEQRARRERRAFEPLPQQRGARRRGERTTDRADVDRCRSQARQIRGLLDDRAGARREVAGGGKGHEALGRVPACVLEHSSRRVEARHREWPFRVARRALHDTDPPLVLAARVRDSGRAPRQRRRRAHRRPAPRHVRRPAHPCETCQEGARAIASRRARAGRRHDLRSEALRKGDIAATTRDVRAEQRELGGGRDPDRHRCWWRRRRDRRRLGARGRGRDPERPSEAQLRPPPRPPRP